jgi:hypothetical protein
MSICKRLRVLEDVLGHESLFACAKQLCRSTNNRTVRSAIFLIVKTLQPAAKLSFVTLSIIIRVTMFFFRRCFPIISTAFAFRPTIKFQSLFAE